MGMDSSNGEGVLMQYAVLSPSEGTIGKVITITGSDFGTKKGKVLIGDVAPKVAKGGWLPDSITCILTRVPPAGTHQVGVTPKGDVGMIHIPRDFTVKLPEIESVTSYEGVTGDSITITGKFFSTKKGKVYLQVPSGKPKTCRVKSWGMNSITFKVPKTSRSFPAGTYPLLIINKVGPAYAPSNFTVN